MNVKLMGIILMVAAAGSLLADDGVVIVNKDAQVQELSTAQLKRIYLGKMRLWSSGQKIKPVYLTEKHAAGGAFFEHQLKMAPREFQKFWIKRTFSGDGAAPRAIKTPEEVVAYVARTPGAVSFIPAPGDTDLSQVDVIKVDASSNGS